jgi:osmotically inducible lipoprotein OsmB
MRVLAAVMGIAILGLSACGDTATERAATGGLGGAVVAGPAGAVVGGTVGAATTE